MTHKYSDLVKVWLDEVLKAIELHSTDYLTSPSQPQMKWIKIPFQFAFYFLKTRTPFDTAME